jgi:hypothetical protein
VGGAEDVVDSAAGVAVPCDDPGEVSSEEDAGEEAATEGSPAVGVDPAAAGSREVEVLAACALDCSAGPADAEVAAACEEPAPDASAEPAAAA